MRGMGYFMGDGEWAGMLEGLTRSQSGFLLWTIGTNSEPNKPCCIEDIRFTAKSDADA